MHETIRHYRVAIVGGFEIIVHYHTSELLVERLLVRAHCPILKGPVLAHALLVAACVWVGLDRRRLICGGDARFVKEVLALYSSNRLCGF